MSGLEVLGLILGIYPLIVNGLQVYRTTKRGGATQRFLRKLGVEQVIFAEFVHNLLASELSEADLARLRDEEPSDLDIWKNKALLLKVRDRLGPKKTELVLGMLDDIKELLKTLQKDVASITATEQADRRSYGRFHGRLQTLRHNLPQSTISQKLDDLTAHNGILQRLLCDRTVHVSSLIGGSAGQRIRYLQRDSSHAVDLYHALLSSFQCECTRPHPANLGVYRLTYDTNGRTKRSIGDDDGQFELLFSLGDEEFEDTDSMEATWSPVSPISSSERSENGQRTRGKRRMSSISIQEYGASESLNTQHSIDDLCSFVKGLEGKSTVAKASLNFLASQEKNYLISMTPPRGSAQTPPSILCVNDFLSADNLPLSREDRIGLALRLSHAVLQFHSTPWIDNNWTWKSFAVAKRLETPGGRHDTSQLFVARNFYSASKASQMAVDSDSSDETAQVALAYPWPEPILTRLGFALIELALGARFAELRARRLPELKTLVPQNLNSTLMNAEILDRWTAKLLVESGVIRREEGQAYEDAVKACLEHQFIQESILRGLKSDGPTFNDDVEQCILAPLYDMWETSWGHVERDSVYSR